jgi:CBS domain-containing protein
VSDAAALMLDLRIDRLPVVDGGEVIGIVTRADLVRAFTRPDDEIEQDIREEGLLRRYWLDPSEVDVAVNDGNVVLSGDMHSPELADSLVAFAERTPGVVSVESRLT